MAGVETVKEELSDVVAEAEVRAQERKLAKEAAESAPCGTAMKKNTRKSNTLLRTEFVLPLKANKSYWDLATSSKTMNSLTSPPPMTSAKS